MERPRIVVIGAGNVATHLAQSLDVNADVVQIMSRDIAHSSALARTMNRAQAIDDFSKLVTDADYYLIAVNDDSIMQVARDLPYVGGVVMHTSGSIGLDAIKDTSEHIGVLYPLQTFSKSVEVNMAEVPIFIEASDEDTELRLRHLALSISDKVYYADSEQRVTLHIAAVFGCNFFNHLLSISDEILQQHGYSLDVLYPLLKVTLKKAMDIGPINAQTGPAARNDIGVINRHIEYLPPHLGEIYQILSESIIKTSHKKIQN